MRRELRILAGITTGCVAGFSIYWFSPKSKPSPTNTPVAIAPAPEPNQFIEASAQDIQAEVRRHKYTLVNIWATWCEPCKEEFPILLELRKKYLSDDFNVLLISADFSSQKNEAIEFLKSHQVDFKSFHKNEDDSQFINALYPQWSGAIPATMIFNQAGELLKHWQGGATAEQFEAAVQAVLHSPAKAAESEARDD